MCDLLTLLRPNRFSLRASESSYCEDSLRLSFDLVDELRSFFEDSSGCTERSSIFYRNCKKIQIS